MDELTNSSISIGVAVAVPAIVCVVIVIGRTGEIGKCRYVWVCEFVPLHLPQRNSCGSSKLWCWAR